MKNEILLRIRREFSEKEKYDILMQDYFNMIRRLSEMEELKDKYNAIKEQHKKLQSKYTKLKNKYEKVY